MVLSDFPILDCAWRFIAVTIVAFATHCVNLAKGKAEFESRMFQTVYVVNYIFKLRTLVTGVRRLGVFPWLFGTTVDRSTLVTVIRVLLSASVPFGRQ